MPLFCSELGEAYAYQVRTSSKRLGTAVSLFPWNVRRLKKIGIFFFKNVRRLKILARVAVWMRRGSRLRDFYSVSEILCQVEKWRLIIIDPAGPFLQVSMASSHLVI